MLVEWILMALLASTCVVGAPLSPLLALRVGLRPALAPPLLSLIDVMRRWFRTGAARRYRSSTVEPAVVPAILPNTEPETSPVPPG